jgi:hypothetical protein
MMRIGTLKPGSNRKEGKMSISPTNRAYKHMEELLGKDIDNFCEPGVEGNHNIIHIAMPDDPLNTKERERFDLLTAIIDIACNELCKLGFYSKVEITPYTKPN